MCECGVYECGVCEWGEGCVSVEFVSMECVRYVSEQ